MFSSSNDRQKEWIAAIDVAKLQAISQFIHAWNQGGVIVDNYDMSQLQLVLLRKNTVNLNERVATTALL